MEDRDRILTRSEVKTFNTYLESGDMRTAFMNSDWCHIYNKITGGNASDWAKELMDAKTNF